MKHVKIAFLTLAALLAVASSTTANEADHLQAAIGSVPEFRLKDQDGNLVTRANLDGKVCIVSFFFSCCTTFCPKTQAAMAGLQDRLAGYPDVLLISINVYPGHDTPEIVAQIARERKAVPGRWLLLHGNDKEINDLVMNGFKQGLALNSDASPGNEVIHTANFMIVDHRGTIRGYANGLDPAEVDEAESFVKRLVQAKYFPAINATLNGACGILLLFGYAFIRARWIVAHKATMLMALFVSAVFLGCYLYYHFAVLNGQPTRFSAEGGVRYLYFSILLTHTLLAVVVAPLALAITYLGLRNRLAGHIKWARITLPLWLYVSVTGVVVYWMLYHLYPPA